MNRRAHDRKIFEKFTLSLQGNAKTWVHGLEAHIKYPELPTRGAWKLLRHLFLRRFNPNGHTETELYMEWEGIKYMPNADMEKVWKKIKTIAGGLGY